jgi:acetyltransferase-like isoleucine patch superfamily enzyme
MKTFLLSILKSINSWINILQIKRKNVSYESFPIINGVIFITGRGKMSLGKHVHFNSSRRSNPIGGDNKLIIDLGTNGNLEIGDYSGISNATIIAHDNIEIGKNVKIGGSVKLYSTDFHSLDPEKRRMSATDIAITKPILIFDNAFIGAHSIVLKGVTIGENSIIGAGSVVTKSVPSNQIWGGNPAKFIKDV